MNTKSTCPPCRRALFLRCERENSGYALRSSRPKMLRAKRPSMNGQYGQWDGCGTQCQSVACPSSWPYVGYEAYEDDPLCLSPPRVAKSPPSIMRSARSCWPANQTSGLSDSSVGTSFSIFPRSSRRFYSEGFSSTLFAFLPVWEITAAPPPKVAGEHPFAVVVCTSSSV